MALVGLAGPQGVTNLCHLCLLRFSPLLHCPHPRWPSGLFLSLHSPPAPLFLLLPTDSCLRRLPPSCRRCMLEQGGITAGSCTNTKRMHPVSTRALMLQERGSSWG